MAVPLALTWLCRLGTPLLHEQSRRWILGRIGAIFVAWRMRLSVQWRHKGRTVVRFLDRAGCCHTRWCSSHSDPKLLASVKSLSSQDAQSTRLLESSVQYWHRPPLGFKQQLITAIHVAYWCQSLTTALLKPLILTGTPASPEKKKRISKGAHVALEA